jgi:hypothetical protein
MYITYTDQIRVISTSKMYLNLGLMPASCDLVGEGQDPKTRNSCYIQNNYRAICK